MKNLEGYIVQNHKGGIGLITRREVLAANTGEWVGVCLIAYSWEHKGVTFECKVGAHYQASASSLIVFGTMEEVVGQ